MNFFRSRAAFKGIKRLLFVIASLIIIGYFNQANYYGYFNVNIFPYLDTSEILLLSLSEMMLITIVWLSVLFIVRSLVVNLGNREVSRLLHRYKETSDGIVMESRNVIAQINAVENNRDVKNLKKYEMLYREAMESLHQLKATRRNILNSIQWAGLGLVAMGILLCFPAFLLISNYFSADIKEISMHNPFEFDYMSLACLISLHLMGYGILILISKPRRLIFRKYPFAIVSLCFILLFIDVRNGLRYRFKMDGTPKFNCAVVLTNSDTQIHSDTANNVYLGATRNFIFFHNRATQEQMIIPLPKVVSIRMAKNHDGL